MSKPKVCLLISYSIHVACGKPTSHVVHTNLSYVTCKHCKKVYKEYKNMFLEIQQKPQILLDKGLLKSIYLKHSYTLNNYRI